MIAVFFLFVVWVGWIAERNKTKDDAFDGRGTLYLC